MSIVNSMSSLAISLFILMDFIGCIPIFACLTQQMTLRDKIYAALLSSLIAGIIILLFAFFGETLLLHFAISLDAIKVGGGILLFYVAFEMLMIGDSHLYNINPDDAARSIIISPLAIPLFAGPGSLTFAMTQFYALAANEKIILVFATLIASFSGALLLIASLFVVHFLNDALTRGLEKITAVVISFIATEMIMNGIQHYYF